MPLFRSAASISYAARVFTGDRLEAEDTRSAYGGIRMKAIGQVGPDILVVIHTMRNEAVRIISARLANKTERSQWQSRA